MKGAKMFQDIYSFPATFEFLGEADKGGECSVYFHDLPGLVSAGDDFDDAEKKAKEGLAMHLEMMIENGEEIPNPSPLDAVPSDPVTERIKIVSITLDDIRKVFLDFYSPYADKTENVVYQSLSKERQIRVANILGIPFDVNCLECTPTK